MHVAQVRSLAAADGVEEDSGHAVRVNPCAPSPRGGGGVPIAVQGRGLGSSLQQQYNIITYNYTIIKI